MHCSCNVSLDIIIIKWQSTLAAYIGLCSHCTIYMPYPTRCYHSALPACMPTTIIAKRLSHTRRGMRLRLRNKTKVSSVCAWFLSANNYSWFLWGSDWTVIGWQNNIPTNNEPIALVSLLSVPVRPQFIRPCPSSSRQPSRQALVNPPQNKFSRVFPPNPQ